MSQTSKTILSEQLVRVRTLAQAQLARFTQLEPSDCKEVYLFHDDQFCGIRFTLGSFKAQWLISDLVLNISRGDRQIAQIGLDSGQGKSAA